tara:strand:- start:204 stop:1859 length:1656 start_codon:yes stop_codon:yes gene_type:complete
MFKDLKEYQDITRIYNESVNISEEQRAINKIFEEEDFTLEELDYIEENYDIIWEEVIEPIIVDELYESVEEIETLTEEQLDQFLDEKLLLKTLAKGALAASKGLRKANIGVTKGLRSAKRGIKDTLRGAKGVAGDAINKVKPFAKKAAKALGTGLLMGTGAALPLGLTGLGVADTIRKRGKAEREAEEAKKAADAKAKADAEKAKSQTKDGGSKASTGALTALALSKSFADAIKSNTSSGPKSTVIQNTMKDGGKKVEKKAPPTSSKPKKMGEIEKQNRKRFGDNRVDFLKQKQQDFKLMRSKKMSKDDFAKKYPNSNTAKDMKKRSRKPAIMDYESYTLDAYDTVLEYLSATEQASTLEEANYIMMEMDQQTIGDIVMETKPLIEGVINELAQRNPYEIIIEYLIQEEVASSVDEAVAIIEELDDETLQQVLDEGFMDRVKSGVKGALSTATGAVGAGAKAVGGAVGKVKTAIGNRINRRKENVAINKKIKEKQSNVDQNNPGKTKAQIMALNRKKEKLNNPKEYERKQNMSGADRAKEMARARLAAKNK